MADRRSIIRTGMLTASVLLLATCAPARANDRYDAWQREHPFTQTAWETHVSNGSQPTDVDALKSAGLNTAFDTVRSGSEASKHPTTVGIPSLLLAYSGHGSPTGVDLEGFIADYKLAAAVQDNIIGIMLGDEVESAEMIAHMRKVRDWIVNSRDPKISRMITVTSEPLLIGNLEGTLALWNKVCEGLQPDALIAQIYPFDAGKVAINGDYYAAMETCFNWSREKDIAMWIWNQTYSSAQLPTESQYRLQKFTGLAYGARGFGDFLWPVITPPTVPGGAYWDYGANAPTELYRQQAVINKEIANIARCLIRLTPVGVYHLDDRDSGGKVRRFYDADTDVPTWLQRTGRLAGMAGIDNANHLLAGFFRDAAGEEYFLVVNKDFGPDDRPSKATVNLTFSRDVRAIERLRREDGAVEKIAVDNNFIFELPAGTGDLFKIGDRGAFAGAHEDSEPSVPKLVSSNPADGRGLGKLKGNSVAIEFDGDAHRVVPEIRRLDEHGKPAGADLGPLFAAEVSEDGKRLVLNQNSAGLEDDATYQIDLHWADAKPIHLRMCRGDVDGDGKLTEADARIVRDEAAKDQPLAQADITGDGAVNDADASVMQRLLHPAKFEWHDSFEKYPDGELVGNGPWLATETLGVKLYTRAVVQGSPIVTSKNGALNGRKKLQGGVYPDYRGAEAIFSKEVGFGDSGMLRLSLLTRLGKVGGGAERISVAIGNSQDTSGAAGAIHVDVLESTNASLYASHGIFLTDTNNGDKGDLFTDVGAIQDVNGKGFRVTIVMNFDAKTITWECNNLETGKKLGPRTVGYKGEFNHLDCVSFWVCGQETQLDDLSIQNF